MDIWRGGYFCFNLNVGIYLKSQIIPHMLDKYLFKYWTFIYTLKKKDHVFEGQLGRTILIWGGGYPREKFAHLFRKSCLLRPGGIHLRDWFHDWGFWNVPLEPEKSHFTFTRYLTPMADGQGIKRTSLLLVDILQNIKKLNCGWSFTEQLQHNSCICRACKLVFSQVSDLNVSTW